MRVAMLLVLLAACGPVSKTTAVTGTWRELRSPRYVMYLDYDVELGREKLRTLEAITSIVGKLYAQGEDPVAAPIVLIGQKRCVAESGTVAMIRSGQTVDLESLPLAVSCGARNVLDIEVAVHIRAHELAARYLPRMPAWLNEGLAWYFGRSRLTPEGIEVGHTPIIFFQAPRAHESAREIRSRTRAEFEGNHARRWTAWAVVATVFGAQPGMVQGYLARLAAGQEAPAWVGMPDEAIDRHLAELAAGRALQGRVIKAPRGEPHIDVRELSPGEALALHVHMLLVQLPDAPTTDLAEALTQIEIADRAEPGADLGLLWRGVLAVRFKQARNVPRDGEALLRTYLARHPGDARVMYGIVSLGFRKLGDRTGLEAAPAPGIETLAQDVARLAAAASTPSELNGVAWFFALARRPDEGLPYARRAISAGPACVECLDSLAVLSFQAGRVDEAISAIQRALALSDDDDDLRPRFTAKLAAFRAAPPPTAPTSTPVATP